MLDLFCTFDTYNDSPNDAQADARAIYSDWHIVGQDLADAMMRVEREPTTSQPPTTAAVYETNRH